MEGEPSTETRLHSVGRNCDRSPQASAPSILFVQPEPDSELLILVGKPTTLARLGCELLTLLYKRSNRTLHIFRGQSFNGTVGTLTQTTTSRPTPANWYVSLRAFTCQAPSRSKSTRLNSS